MSSRGSRKGRFFRRRKAKPLEPEASEELRALDPRTSLDDWLEYMELTGFGTQPRVKVES
jgi:hypothetical protein